MNQLTFKKELEEALNFGITNPRYEVNVFGRVCDEYDCLVLIRNKIINTIVATFNTNFDVTYNMNFGNIVFFESKLIIDSLTKILKKGE